MRTGGRSGTNGRRARIARGSKQKLPVRNGRRRSWIGGPVGIRDGHDPKEVATDQGRRVKTRVGRTRQLQGLLGTVRRRFDRGTTVIVIDRLGVRCRLVMSAGEKTEGREGCDAAMTGRWKPDDQSQEPNPQRPTHARDSRAPEQGKQAWGFNRTRLGSPPKASEWNYLDPGIVGTA